MLRSTFQLLSRTEGLFVYSNCKYIFELNGKPTSELCEEFNATYTTPKQAFLGSNLVPVLETQFRFRVGICGVWGGNARTESGFLRKISKFFFSFWETWIFFLQVDLVNPLSNTHTGDTDLRIYDPRKQVGPNLRSGIGWLWKSGVSIPILKIIVSTWGVFKDVKIFRLTCCRSYNSKFVCASNGYERQWNMLKLKSNEYYTRLHSTGVDIPARYKIDSKHKKSTILFTTNRNQNSSHTFGKIQCRPTFCFPWYCDYSDNRKASFPFIPIWCPERTSSSNYPDRHWIIQAALKLRGRMYYKRGSRIIKGITISETHSNWMWCTLHWLALYFR